MSNRFKISLFIAVAFLIPAAVCLAADTSFGLRDAATVAGLSENKLSQSGGVPALLGDLVAIALALVGVFFFLMILIAGFTWMTAAGSSERLEKAKSRLFSAGIGLVIVLAAYTANYFVFSNFLAGAGGGQSANCASALDGAACGVNKVCQRNKCIERCVFEYGGSASCRGITQCQYSVKVGLCSVSGKECCVPPEASLLPQAGVQPPSSGPTCKEQGGYCTLSGSCSDKDMGKTSDCSDDKTCCVNACQQKGGIIVASESACSDLSGKIEAGAAPAGKFCCKTCNSMGGNCFFSESYTCGGKTFGGYCPKGYDEQPVDCCVGKLTEKPAK